MTDDTTLPFPFSAVQRKKVTAAFYGGRITSDGGVMLLVEAERRLGTGGGLWGRRATARQRARRGPGPRRQRRRH